jgi:hypothetical protein
MKKLKQFFNNVKVDLKARWTAKRFDIYKEVLDPDRRRDGFFQGDFLSSDGYIYYGHPLFIYFRSSQNSWFQDKEYQERRKQYLSSINSKDQAHEKNNP